MAYTRSWTNNTPLDSDQASTLGVAIRNLRQDINDRMATLVGTGTNNWTTDPIWAGYTGAAAPVPYVIYIPAQASVLVPSSTLIYAGNANYQAADGSWGYSPNGLNPAGNLTIYVPFTLPIGIQITKVRGLLYWTAGSTATAAGVFKQNLGTVAVGQANLNGGVNLCGVAVNAGTANWNWYDFGLTAAYTPILGDAFFAQIALSSVTTNSNTRYGGLEITYTKGNVTQSI